MRAILPVVILLLAWVPAGCASPRLSASLPVNAVSGSDSDDGAPVASVPLAERVADAPPLG